MPKYLIQVPHEKSKRACEQAIEVFKNTGSHFLTNADWGCADDVHIAWIVAELDDRELARMIVPPPFQDQAEIIKLDKLSMENMDESMSQHED